MEVVLYTDLNCPFCYATERRLEALGAQAQAQVEWRGVEHEPDLPEPMRADDEEIAAELAEEVDSVRSRAPDVEIELPAGKPNTARAIAATVAAERSDPERGRAFRHAAYRAFWVEGADLSQPDVIDRLVRESGLGSLDVLPEDELQVTNWRLDWERSPLRGVPLLVRSDGEVLYGLKELETLRAFMRPD